MEISDVTDKDNYMFKRIDLSGFLIGTIFRDLYFRYKNNVEYTLNQEFSKLQQYTQENSEITINTLLNQNNIWNIFSQSWMNEGFRYAFKNAWGLKGAKGNKLGIVQDLNRNCLRFFQFFGSIKTFIFLFLDFFIIKLKSLKDPLL